ncbi:Sec-independent protein translocase protein TatA [Deinococcus aerolatus]|uniref:Sec-independent protein translocase protein TatA n=1 Tax=Deinococcus aerolatus TaxID=522487 RepID=A0ABQ2G1F6_9DEIO|nr:twin-arginine translocase TatA/TatE family subunit [Deinococcus aerolatus]GGL70335.1 Sec-independent protein translocase protein TatA [Deinococcus aerolatus]
MPNIGPAELIVILIVALVVFGPRKLPELGKSLGAGLREFRKSTQGLKDELDVGLNDRSAQAAPTQTIHATVPAQPVSAAAVTPQTQPAEGGTEPVTGTVHLDKEKEPVQG